MFCTKCGAACLDGTSFCSKCGARIVPLDPQPQPTPSSPAYHRPVTTEKKPLSSHPVLNAVKTLGTSPLFLLATIAFTAQIFFSFLGIFDESALLTMLPRQVLEALPREAFSQLFLIQLATSLFLIPSILKAVGMWNVYRSASDRLSNTMRTSGLTMIKVISIIELVVFSVFFLLYIVGAVLFSISLEKIMDFSARYTPIYSSPVYYPSIPDEAIPFIFLAFFIVIVLFALLTVYAAKTVQTINAMKKTIQTGVPIPKASSFVAVFSFILAPFSLAPALVGEDFVAISTWCSVVSLVAFGIFIFNYNSKMQSFLMPSPGVARHVPWSAPFTPQTPVAPQAPIAPQAPTTPDAPENNPQIPQQ